MSHLPPTLGLIGFGAFGRLMAAHLAPHLALRVYDPAPAAMRAAAQELGNTPAVARASYVDPRVVDHFDQGRTIDPARSKSAESELLGLLRSP